MGNILVIGGTGNMGRPLVKSLVESGHCVSVVCRKMVGEEDVKRLEKAGGRYFYGDAKDKGFMDGVLSHHFDAIVDFCIYTSKEFKDRIDTFLEKTDQYVCLSTAAVYADISTPKNESSPRYMEVDPPEDGSVKWNWYCYEKARIEDILHNSGKRNWTIVRPGITMNANHVGWGMWWNDDWMGRIIRGRKVAVESDMLDYRFSLSSGAQVAYLIHSVIGNPKTLGEVFNVCSSKAWSWREMLEAYREIFAKHGYKLRVRYINSSDHLLKKSAYEYVYKRARLLDRVFDNAKIRRIVTPTQILEKDLAELLDEWTECYIRNYKRPIISQNSQLRQMAEIDTLAGDCSPRCDFSSSRLYLKYLLMRYCPKALALYSSLTVLASSALRRTHRR